MLIFRDQQWACTTDKNWTFGYEMPDWSLDDSAFCKVALESLRVNKDQKSTKALNNFFDVLISKFGRKISNKLVPLIHKYTGSNPENFSVDAEPLMQMFSRINLGQTQKCLFKKAK